jgi:transposase InsO family protein
MRQDFPLQGIKNLCRLFGKTRHAYYDRQWRVSDQGLKDEIVLQNVLAIRKELPRLGTLKLQLKLKDGLRSHGIKIGRDYLFGLMRDHNLLIRARKRNTVTTNSRHWMHKYANLVRELQVHRPEQLWVSDITYIRLRGKWGYLSLITDAYSRQIMGFSFRTDLSAKGCTDALEMAIKNRLYPALPLIHHSDRGSQYCSKAYVDILLEGKIAISMAQSGDPYENALAERVNRTIKSEFQLHSSRKGLKETTNKIRESIRAYNRARPHSSIDYLTPQQAHQCSGQLKKHWKSKAERRKNKVGITKIESTNLYV